MKWKSKWKLLRDTFGLKKKKEKHCQKEQPFLCQSCVSVVHRVTVKAIISVGGVCFYIEVNSSKLKATCGDQ